MKPRERDTKKSSAIPEDTSVPGSQEVVVLSRAACEVLAERTGVLAPGTPLSDELMAFAEAVARMAVHGGHGEGGTG
jgi:hypothetical protein